MILDSIYKRKKVQLQKLLEMLYTFQLPWIIKGIGIFGTIAMLAVGGGIVAHETHILHFMDGAIKAIPLGGFLSEIILGGIVGFLTVNYFYFYAYF